MVPWPIVHATTQGWVSFRCVGRILSVACESGTNVFNFTIANAFNMVEIDQRWGKNNIFGIVLIYRSILCRTMSLSCRRLSSLIGRNTNCLFRTFGLSSKLS